MVILLDHIILQNDLLTLERRATVWDMQFNPSKCCILSMKRDGDKSLHFYTLCGQVLQSVTNNPYLGVTVTIVRANAFVILLNAFGT